MRRFHVNIEDADFKWLTALSEDKDVTISELIREAVAKYRQGYQSAEESFFKRDTPFEPSERENSDEELRTRLKNLEWFVYQVMASELPVPNRALFALTEYAPDYILGRRTNE